MNRFLMLPGAGIACLLLAMAPGPSAAADGKALLASDPLKKEHLVVLQVADAAREEAARIRRSGSIDPGRVMKLHDFFHNFADRCHHAKEERFFFPAVLVREDVAVRVRIEEALAEHAYGRAMLQQVAYLVQKRQGENPELVADRLARYAEMIRLHIAKENALIFDRGDLVLPPSEQEALRSAFSMIEEVELGEGFHEKYHALAEELAGQGS